MGFFLSLPILSRNKQEDSEESELPFIADKSGDSNYNTTGA